MPPLNEQGQRHEARHRAACTTMAPPPPRPRLRAVRHADGRTAFPCVVQYRVARWDDALDRYEPAELVDLPPSFAEHQDEHLRMLARVARRPYLPATIPYTAVVHDLAAYDWLKARGLLDVGHRVALDDVVEAIDHGPAGKGG